MIKIDRKTKKSWCGSFVHSLCCTIIFLGINILVHNIYVRIYSPDNFRLTMLKLFNFFSQKHQFVSSVAN